MGDGKRNDPDIVVRIRHYVGERTPMGMLSPRTRDLLTEAADTIVELRERAEVADVRAEGFAMSLDAATLRWHEENARHGETARERDRYREAVVRLRDHCMNLELFLDDGSDDVEAALRDTDALLATTTDEAIQGYPEPPEPDKDPSWVAISLAREAASEVERELRAEHYILAGYEPPDGTRIPAGWTRADNGDWWVHESGAMEVRDWTDAGREWVAFWPEVADGLPPTAQGVAPTLFAAMRAAKEAAHALGIDTSEVKP